MRRLSRATAALVVALCASVTAVPAAWAQRVPRFERERVNGRDAVAREVLVKFRDPLLIQDLLDIRAQTDAVSVERVGTTGTRRIRSRSKSATALIRRSSGASTSPTPSRTTSSRSPRRLTIHSFRSWGLSRSRPCRMGASVGANSNVVVAVIDTGIDYSILTLRPMSGRRQRRSR
jgi:hypothetical protein